MNKLINALSNGSDLQRRPYSSVDMVTPGIQKCSTPFPVLRRVVMLMAGGKLRVAFATTHIAIKDVPQSITPEGILGTITICNEGLKQYYGLKRPRIAVCGLNPHAGEEGIFGDEEGGYVFLRLKRRGRKGFTATAGLCRYRIFTRH